MGATYTRQSSYTDGDVIQASDTNDEFDQLLAAFASSTGHTHDGTAGEGGPITKLLGTAITIGDGTAGTDIAVTFDGESNDGVLTWKEDEDYFEFSDDVLFASTEKVQFGDTASFIQQSSDGVLRIDGEATIDLNASTAVTISNDLKLDSDSAVLGFGADNDVTITHVADTGILLNSTSVIQFNDASQNIGAPNATTLDINATDEVEINATLIDINGNLDVSGTITVGSAGISEAELEILDGATVTTTELNIIDGDTAASSTTVADADRVVFNDGGTMKQVAVTDLAAYFDDEITAMPNLVTTAATTVGALDSGSISTGFGNIDNGASNITSGGLLKLDVDADADDLTGDSATGRLTIGAGEDLNLYHGGTNSYIVNDTGDLIIDTADDIVLDADGGDVFLKDAGTQYAALTNSSGNLIIKSGSTTAVTFDGANATFAGTVTIGSAGLNETELEILDGATVTTAELNIMDGDTAASSTTVADADRVVFNDNGTMKQVAVTDLAAYFDDEITAMPNLVTTAATTVGALDSGSITSGFGSIDTGSSNITTTGLISGGSLDIDNVLINGTTIGHTDDTDLITLADGVVTVAGELDATTGDFSSDVDIDGDLLVGDDLTLDSDAAVLGFGADKDVTLTHVADTGLLLNSTMAIQFNDASQFINAPSATVLDINATDEIELNATLADINANLDVSGTYTGGGLMTTGGNIVIPDAGNIGSASDTDAISIGADGDVTLTQDLELAHDGATLSFGADSEIFIEHVADSGLTLKHTATADDKPVNLTLATGETDMAANDVIGKISFQAPDEGTGTDAVLVSGALQARAEGDFSSSSNATSLDFMTGSSEAATTKMTLTSAGSLGIGTTAPDARLDVAGAGVPLEVDSTNSNAFKVQFKDAGSAVAFFGASANTFFFGNSSAAQLARIDSDGIKFGTDSAAANGLGDYEEGTWTPAYIGSSSNPTVTHSVQVGRYVKIGQFVLVSFRVQTNAATGGSGGLRISGLPFNPDGVQASGVVSFSDGFTNHSPQALFVATGESQIQLFRNSGSGATSGINTSITPSELTNGTGKNDIIGTITYRTS